MFKSAKLDERIGLKSTVEIMVGWLNTGGSLGTCVGNCAEEASATLAATGGC